MKKHMTKRAQNEIRLSVHDWFGEVHRDHGEEQRWKKQVGTTDNKTDGKTDDKTDGKTDGKTDDKTDGKNRWQNRWKNI